MLSVIFQPLMLSAIMVSVVMLKVAAPFNRPIMTLRLVCKNGSESTLAYYAKSLNYAPKIIMLVLDSWLALDTQSSQPLSTPLRSLAKSSGTDPIKILEP